MLNKVISAALAGCALVFAQPAAAASYVLDLTGTVSSGTSANVTAGGHRFDFFSIDLQGFDPLTLAVGDEVLARITLDQSLTVPSAFFRNGTRLFLINSSFPSTSTGVAGTTEFFNGGSSFLLSPSGGGASGVVANQYNNAAGTSFTFDAVQSNFIVTSLSDPTLFVDRAALDYFLDNPAVAAVPEPESWALMLLGMVAIGAMLRARRAPAVRFAA